MAALATVAKKVWSARRLLVLLFAPLALLPVVFALPPKVTPPLPVHPPSASPAAPHAGPFFPKPLKPGTAEVPV